MRASTFGCALQVYGPESSGKTTLALHAIAEVQRQGGVAALIDAEHAFDPEYSRVCSHVPDCALFLSSLGTASLSFLGSAESTSRLLFDCPVLLQVVDFFPSEVSLL